GFRHQPADLLPGVAPSRRRHRHGRGCRGLPPDLLAGRVALSPRCGARAGRAPPAVSGPAPMSEGKPEVVITYCRQCQWMLRAAWLAQELLSTFSEELGRVSLEPGTGGV